MKTALAQGLIRCHECGLVSKKPAPTEAAALPPSCSLCGAPLHPRIQYSLARTTAFLLSGYALYIPANIYPIMNVTQFGAAVPHTIIGGILSLMDSNMIPIALLVLIASILVPLSKLLGITLLVLCARYRWQVNARLWTLMYRIIAFVGRWSMLDIFMISILVSLVDLGGVARIIAGPAATAFAAVVVLTMFAAKSFDSRLIWDNQERP
ncbi:MAG: paraquat-inducible protein A [Methylosarcina sp.]